MVILQVTQLAMFESVDLAARPNWKLRIALAVVVLANRTRGFLHGDEHELLIEEKVRKKK